MNAAKRGDNGLYERIYTIVRAIPEGTVATYGQIAMIEGTCTARQVGYAMAAVPGGSDVPWHRVINHRGQVSERSGGSGASRQRSRLAEEGILVDASGRIDIDRYGWRA